MTNALTRACPSGCVSVTYMSTPMRRTDFHGYAKKDNRRVGSRRGPGFEWSGRIEARTGLRMMPTSPRSPLSAGQRVFPSTAGRLAYQAGPAQFVFPA